MTESDDVTCNPTSTTDCRASRGKWILRLYVETQRSAKRVKCMKRIKRICTHVQINFLLFFIKFRICEDGRVVPFAAQYRAVDFRFS
jgi:hypothetical protein